MNDKLPFNIVGHVLITDDLDNILLNQYNAVHPQNLARAIGRSLANESNGNIYRIAFGNGGTSTDAAYTVTYNTPNTGQDDNINQTYDTRLYNETYSEIVDETLSTVGTDPGSSDETGTRPGGGASPSDDPTDGVGVISQEVGFTSLVTVTSILNTSEPAGQQDSSSATDTESAFVFDELGLYTSGAPAKPSNASIDISVGVQTADDDSGLVAGQLYTFQYQEGVSSGFSTVTFTPPSAGGSGTNAEITFGDLCEAINTSDSAWGFGTDPIGSAVMLITSTDSTYSTLTGIDTNGALRIQSINAGASEYVDIASGTTNDMIIALSAVVGSAVIGSTVTGQDAGVQNNLTDPTTEQERLLTHIIFAPVLKSPTRTLTITYTLSIAVAATT